MLFRPALLAVKKFITDKKLKKGWGGNVKPHLKDINEDIYNQSIE